MLPIAAARRSTLPNGRSWEEILYRSVVASAAKIAEREGLHRTSGNDCGSHCSRPTPWRRYRVVVRATSGVPHFSGFFDHLRGRRRAIDSIRFTPLPIPATISSKGEAMTQKSGSTPSTGVMTPAAAARIQSATAHSHGGKTPAGSFAARAQAAAARNSGGGKK